MLFFLIVGLLLGATTIIFALQNISLITVVFFNWQIHGSSSLILLSAFASGVLVCVLVSIPEFFNNHMEFTMLKRTIKKLEEDNASYKRIVEDVAKISETKVVETTTSTTNV